MDILFWSGGKDSYLALEFYRHQLEEAELNLLTTYNRETQLLDHQNIAIKDIRKQAAELELPLIEIPLPPSPPNEAYLDVIHEKLQNMEDNVDGLIFGDWKNEEIREWRESELGEQMGYACYFPIWRKSLHKLFPVLLFKPVKVFISAVQEQWLPYLKTGEEYTQQLVAMLPDGMDPMGENGEFHTRVELQSLNEEVA